MVCVEDQGKEDKLPGHRSQEKKEGNEDSRPEKLGRGCLGGQGWCQGTSNPRSESK